MNCIFCNKVIQQRPGRKVTCGNKECQRKLKRKRDNLDRKTNPLRKRREYLYNKKRRLSNPTRYRESSILGHYRRTDQKRGFCCDLTVSWLKENITSQPCTYCGSRIKIGCDRIDNKQGHIKLNVTPCCKRCNCIRMDNLTHQEMIELSPLLTKFRIKRELKGAKNDW